jgi:dTDP-4-dehydrorhamnose 3,5-epimerase
MIFSETELQGAFLIELEKISDERGFFARTYCQSEFRRHGLDTEIVQCNMSLSKRKGTLRGMHFQDAPYKEAKLVSCVKGSIYDVIIDLRPSSSTYCRWFSAELNDENNKMLYVPEGFAHGFQAMEDNAVVFYQMSEFYHPECSNGVRWDDPAFGIEWPIANPILSERDRCYPDFLRD